MPASQRPPLARSAPWPRATQAALLHHGSADHGGTWASLGCWADGNDYATAATALAVEVGCAAGLRAGQRVLSVACGHGDELLLWSHRFGVAEVVGVERNGAAAQAARQRIAGAGAADRITVLAADAMRLDAAALGRFDAVLCVDAAYHLSPRSSWLQQVHALLNPGGRLAFTDLSRPAEATRRPGLRFAGCAGCPSTNCCPTRRSSPGCAPRASSTPRCGTWMPRCSTASPVSSRRSSGGSAGRRGSRPGCARRSPRR